MLLNGNLLTICQRAKIKSVTYVVLQFELLSALKGGVRNREFLTIPEKCYLCCAIRQLRNRRDYQRKKKNQANKENGFSECFFYEQMPINSKSKCRRIK